MTRKVNTGIFDGGMPCYVISKCGRNNSCRSCDDEKCRFAGDTMADCPKWTCDNGYNCTKCEFIDSYIKVTYGE